MELNNDVGADYNTGVKIEKVFGGYFSDQKNIDDFIQIGIVPILSELKRKKEVTVADFGGGAGNLAKGVKDFLMNHFEEDVMLVEKFRSDKIFSAVYYDADLEYYYLKRFTIDPIDKLTSFIGDNEDSRLLKLSEVEYPRLEVSFGGRHKDRENEIIEVAEFIGVKSYKARGKRLSNYEVKVVKELEPLIVKQEEPEVENHSDEPKDDDKTQMSLFGEENE